MDPKNEQDRKRLSDAIVANYEAMSHFRVNVGALVKQSIGAKFGGEQEQHKTVLNLIYQAQEGFTLGLVGGYPRFFVDAFQPAQRSFAARYQFALNRLADELYLCETLQNCVRDAFFGPSYAKVFVGDAAEPVIINGQAVNPGQPVAMRISPHDMVHDTLVGDWRQTSFTADRVRRIPVSALRDKTLFKQRVVERLLSNRDGRTDDPDTSPRRFGVSEVGETGEIEDTVDLLNVYLRRERRLCTWLLVGNDFSIEDSDPLIDQEWTGAECGPHLLLNLGPVPDHAMPISRAGNLKYMAEVINSILRKLNDSANDEKVINLFTGDQGDLAARLRDAAHEEWVGVPSTEGVLRHQMGGISTPALAFLLQVLQFFDRMSGNPQARLGLGTSAPTLGQEQMVMNQIATLDTTLQEKVTRFASDIGRGLGRLLFDDPYKTIAGSQEIPGSGFHRDMTWKPGQRQGQPSDYDVRVMAASLAYKTPRQRAQLLRDTMIEVVQMGPLAAEQGVRPNIREYLAALAELHDEPLIPRIVDFDQPPSQMGASHERTKPPETTRHVTRSSEGQQSPQEQNAAAALQSAMSAGPNNNGVAA